MRTMTVIEQATALAECEFKDLVSAACDGEFMGDKLNSVLRTTGRSMDDFKRAVADLQAKRRDEADALETEADEVGAKIAALDHERRKCVTERQEVTRRLAEAEREFKRVTADCLSNAQAIRKQEDKIGGEIATLNAQEAKLRRRVDELRRGLAG